jgi:hypothetical protein
MVSGVFENANWRSWVDAGRERAKGLRCVSPITRFLDGHQPSAGVSPTGPLVKSELPLSREEGTTSCPNAISQSPYVSETCELTKGKRGRLDVGHWLGCFGSGPAGQRHAARMESAIRRSCGQLRRSREWKSDSLTGSSSTNRGRLRVAGTSEDQ